MGLINQDHQNPVDIIIDVVSKYHDDVVF